MKSRILTLMAGLCLLCTNMMYAQSPCEGNLRNIYATCVNLNVDCNAYTTPLGDIEFELGSISCIVSDEVLVHKEVHFYVNTNLGSNCQGVIDIKNTYINFNDGQGEQLIVAGAPIIYQYNTFGNKNVTFRVKYEEYGLAGDASRNKNIEIEDNNQGGISYEYEAPDDIWEIETDIFTPPCSDAYPQGSKYDIAGKGYGTAYIKYANPNNPALRNPVIFVDGVDFTSDIKYYDPNLPNNPIVRHGATGWDVLSGGLMKGADDVQLFAEMPIQIDAFQQAGYDLIFLDFHDGVDYIQRNALVLEKLLDDVNTAKDCDGDDIVVIGASMGGQIARYALTKMESENKHHGVRTYVSFDSPQQGAVVPMGVQASVWALANIQGEAGAQELWDRLDAPASRQMLYENFVAETKEANQFTPTIKKI